MIQYMYASTNFKTISSKNEGSYMDFNNLIDRSMKEMLSFMQTEEFSEKVNNDATVAFIFEYSKILLSNYHKELTSTLQSKGIEI